MSPPSPSLSFARLRAFMLVCLSCLAALAGVLPPTPAVAREAAPTTDLHCPTHLAQIPVTDGVPPGWVVHAQLGELRLQRATFYEGDPVGLATLAPDATHRSGLTETSTWRFGAGAVAGDSARVWLACLYRDATAVVARPLPAGLQQCTTVLRLTPLGEPSEPLSVACR